MEIPEHWKNRFLQGFLLISISTLAVGIYAYFSATSHSGENELVILTPSPSALLSITQVLSASTSATPIIQSTKIYVDVSGAVTRSGVYELSADTRLTSALDAAGGLAKNADTAWVAKNLNLATKLSDGDKIYIPQKGEIKVQGSILQAQVQSSQQAANEGVATTTPQVAGVTTGALGVSSQQVVQNNSTSTPQATTKSSNAKISVNSSSVAELDTLPGVGEITAQKIINARPYSKLEELKEKKAVNKSTYEKIVGLIEL